MHSKALSNIPRGFTRFFILKLLSEKPMTGKEIMEEALQRTSGLWRPSPGLIYPLLAKLSVDELIEETSQNKYRITSKGKKELNSLNKFLEAYTRQLEILHLLRLLEKHHAPLLAEHISQAIKVLKELLSSDPNLLSSLLTSIAEQIQQKR
ncbi:MAG TPA: PadR family transcriptional regulator [Candidatus Methanomethylia archaeon]|nr:PadR family transcriptional regulator [Candidatus Methanomethylicia archaeon]